MPREFSAAVTANLLTHMATTTRAGLPIRRTLVLLQENQRNARVRHMWAAVERDIGRGATLGEALRRQSPPLPPLAVELITAGEQSGQLELVLRQLRQYYSMRAALKRSALGAAAYPTFVAFFGLGVLTLLTVITASDKWGAFYGLLAKFGLVGLVVGLVVCGVAFTRAGRWFWQGFILYTPIIGGAVRRLVMARFARTLAMMYASGLPPDTGLDRAIRAAGNVHAMRSLEVARRRVRDGDLLSEAFNDVRIMPSLMREMLQTGEQTGTYDETLAHVAEILEDEAHLVLTNLPKLIAPVMLIGIGLLVVFLYYRFYLKPYILDPINSLY